MAEAEEDHVERLLRQWARELPEIDTGGAAILGRARRVTLQARREIEAVFARYGLDAGEFDVLATLRRSGPPYRLRPTELYRSLMISSGGLTDRLQRLERAGLVQRRGAEEDGRSVLVELTDAGRETVEAAFREDMAIENRLVAALSPEERSLLARLLRRLALAVGA